MTICRPRLLLRRAVNAALGATPKSNRLWVQSTGNYLKAYDWSPDDKQVAYCEFISNTVATLNSWNR